MTEPRGLVEMLDALKSGCQAKGKGVSVDVDREVLTRFRAEFKALESEWDANARQVLSVAGLTGRLAALYAANAREVGWPAARLALKDAQEECSLLPAGTTKGIAIRGKWCREVDLDN